ncbi:TetR/AcrR family transcriptional regulator [Phytohabitans aurantiacus]|jgi:AcrR family transcriptional regulator|uniref:TetR family transcriptional regulator n=1 Tax=Phytohabitans aurantiacus TaxID=3016789 RepID=A0ABQ5QQN2_9ACTN|nr:TetR/AcrR family transcriptional regulator [Phytohabitans aurantiacus]GLH96557.1 TetR family transcriptional regulator [Phytohabitans aurantiacus]
MTNLNKARTGPRQHEPRGWPEKRRAIAEAARRVFGRDGYTRASVDAIAAEAGVSKRTVYNHFADKEQLFLAVAIEGADEVTAAIAQIMDRHLRKIVDLEQDLIDFSLDRVAAVTAFPDHFALVRALEAEATHIPRPMLRAWIDAGPQTAHLRLAPYLRKIADRGLLRLDDADRAARHLTLLTIADINQQTFYGAVPLPQEEITDIVTAGVKAFLHIYR